MLSAVAGNLTDPGRQRQENQDYYGDFEPDGGHRGRLLVVADGVGGHRGGKLASRLAVDIVGEVFFRTDQPGDAAERLKAAFVEANRRIFRKAVDDPELRGMASTCTAVALAGGTAFTVHLGDSRAYLLRDGHLRRLTRDHSIVQERIDAGLLTPEQARTHAERNVITRSLGFEAEVDPEMGRPLPLLAGDRLILSTDGLHGLLSDEEIAETVLAEDPMEACEQLVAAANARGGPDNVTVQVLRIESP